MQCPRDRANNSEDFYKTLVTIGILVFILPSCKNETPAQSGGFPSPAVSVAKVVEREVTPWVELNGRIEAQQVVQIRPQVGGLIDKKAYREGDIVKKGDLLFTIEQQPFRAEVNRAEADLARAKAQQELSQVESQRATNLLKSKLISQDEYDKRLASEHQASANVKALQASKRLAILNLGYTKIRSPINGRTGRALATKGNLVSSTPTPDLLTTVVSLDPVYVIFDCDEMTYLQYFSGAQQSADYNGNQKRIVYVGLSNEDGFPRQGFIDFVDNRINTETGTIRLRAILDNKDHQLTPGLFARVKLMGAEPRQSLLIDDQAVLTDQDRKYIYILGDENRAMRRDISLGSTIDGLRVVSAGLHSGDKVIVHGIQKIFFPNMPVVPQMISMGDPPPAVESKPAVEH
ncbi:MAG: efflux RND transporter periplasmic adaptor subunit [Thiohalomonadales bacterium]